MKREFNLDIKPFSINAMYYGDGRTKTQAARDWSYQIFHRLSQEAIAKSLAELRSYFETDKHSYQVDFVVTYPKDKFYTKKGSISARTMDLSNWEKPLIDLIFLPKYFDKEPPYGCKNLNIDDKYITKLSSSKGIGETTNILVKICILEM